MGRGQKIRRSFFAYCQHRHIIAIMTQKAALRIIDANFNRAREALRVVEEYCRFALNSAHLSARTKQIRHDLTHALTAFDLKVLVTCRDTAGDVGTASLIADPLERSDLEDCLRAGCKRLTEALRTLSEIIQIDDPRLAKVIEALRYQSYTLEKDIILLGIPAQRFQSVRLYVLLGGDDRDGVLTLAEQCARGGADCLQLRAKELCDRDWLNLAKEFVEICRYHDVLSIINDRTDIAVASGADGVHLGLEDLPIEDARRLQLQPLIFGLTTHNHAELSVALKKIPSYVALGPAFPTSTKPHLHPAGLAYVAEGLAGLPKEGVGHVVIGGINAENVRQVCALGATAIAVGAHITTSRHPKEACMRLKASVVSAASS